MASASGTFLIVIKPIANPGFIDRHACGISSRGSSKVFYLWFLTMQLARIKDWRLKDQM